MLYDYLIPCKESTDIPGSYSQLRLKRTSLGPVSVLERVPFYRELTKRKGKMQVTTVGVRFSNVCVLEVFVKIIDCTHLFLMVQHIHFDLPSVV